MEVRGDGDRSTAALHFLPGDDRGYHRDPDGRTSHLRVRGPGSYNRDLPWKINSVQFRKLKGNKTRAIIVIFVSSALIIFSFV